MEEQKNNELIRDLKIYLADLEKYKEEYQQAQENPKLDQKANGGYFRGKHDAYGFMASKIKNILIDNGINSER